MITPVIAAVSGADLALPVTEPTVADIQDLRRAMQTVQHFGVPALVCINKADVYPDGAREIEAYCGEYGIDGVGPIPFDSAVPGAMVAGEAVTAYRPHAPASLALSAVWEQVLAVLSEAPAGSHDVYAPENPINPQTTRRLQMKIAVTAESSQGLDSQVAQHFGHAPYFILVDIENGAVTATRDIANPFAEAHQPGQIPDFIKEQQVEVMLSGGMGGRAIEFFTQAGIRTATGASGTVRASLESYLGGTLAAAAPCAESVAHGHG